MLARVAFVLVLALPTTAAAQDDWLHRGDVLAASDEAADLEGAIAAYAHVAPSDPTYPMALQRIAWALFLLDRTTESIAAYASLVDRLAPSTMRDEAIVMLAAMFADLDWDRDGTLDAASPLARLSDPALVARDRPWLGDLLFATARALHRASRDPMAIAVVAHALERWPAPTDGNPMRSACRRHRARPETLHAESPAERSTADATCARYGF